MELLQTVLIVGAFFLGMMLIMFGLSVVSDEFVGGMVCIILGATVFYWLATTENA